jgi:hypothetical protein
VGGLRQRLGDPDHPDVRPAPEPIGEPVAGLVNGGHHGHIPPEQIHDRRTEGGRGKLHLAQLVDNHHPAGPGVAQRRQPDPLQGGQVHTVPAHPGRTRKIDVGQNSRAPETASTTKPSRCPPVRSSPVVNPATGTPASWSSFSRRRATVVLPIPGRPSSSSRGVPSSTM